MGHIWLYSSLLHGLCLTKISSRTLQKFAIFCLGHNVFGKPKKLYFHRNTLCRLKFYGKIVVYKYFFCSVLLENLLLEIKISLIIFHKYFVWRIIACRFSIYSFTILTHNYVLCKPRQFLK